MSFSIRLAASLNHIGAHQVTSLAFSASILKSSIVLCSGKVDGDIASSHGFSPLTFAISSVTLLHGRCHHVPTFAPCHHLKWNA